MEGLHAGDPLLLQLGAEQPSADERLHVVREVARGRDPAARRPRPGRVHVGDVRRRERAGPRRLLDLRGEHVAVDGLHVRAERVGARVRLRDRGVLERREGAPGEPQTVEDPLLEGLRHRHPGHLLDDQPQQHGVGVGVQEALTRRDRRRLREPHREQLLRVSDPAPQTRRARSGPGCRRRPRTADAAGAGAPTASDSRWSGPQGGAVLRVELRGFEPLTPSMRTRCATGLRHSP